MPDNKVVSPHAREAEKKARGRSRGRTIYDEADAMPQDNPCPGISDGYGCSDPWCEGCRKCGLHHPRTARSPGCEGFR